MGPESSVKFSKRETKRNVVRNLKEEAGGEVCGMARLDWFEERAAGCRLAGVMGKCRVWWRQGVASDGTVDSIWTAYS
jgi:hypothetical protein